MKPFGKKPKCPVCGSDEYLRKDQSGKGMLKWCGRCGLWVKTK